MNRKLEKLLKGICYFWLIVFAVAMMLAVSGCGKESTVIGQYRMMGDGRCQVVAQGGQTLHMDKVPEVNYISEHVGGVSRCTIEMRHDKQPQASN